MVAHQTKKRLPGNIEEDKVASRFDRVDCMAIAEQRKRTIIIALAKLRDQRPFTRDEIDRAFDDKREFRNTFADGYKGRASFDLAPGHNVGKPVDGFFAERIERMKPADKSGERFTHRILPPLLQSSSPETMNPGKAGVHLFRVRPTCGP